MSQIARLDFDPDDPDEDDPFAFEAVAEQPRVAVLSVQHGLQPATAARQSIQ